MTAATPETPTINPDFEQWCYRAEDLTTTSPFPDGGHLPLLTTLLIRVCENDGTRFDEALRIMQMAFEGGKATGLPAQAENPDALTAAATIERLREALVGLEKAATEVARYGAQTGSQWTRLAAANLKARSELAALKGAKP